MREGGESRTQEKSEEDAGGKLFSYELLIQPLDSTTSAVMKNCQVFFVVMKKHTRGNTVVSRHEELQLFFVVVIKHIRGSAVVFYTVNSDAGH